MTINRPACSFRIVIISVMFDRATQFADDERRHRANDGISSERLSSIRARGEKKNLRKMSENRLDYYGTNEYYARYRFTSPRVGGGGGAPDGRDEFSVSRRHREQN